MHQLKNFAGMKNNVWTALFELQIGDLIGVKDVQTHGGPGAFAVSGLDKTDDLPVILQGSGTCRRARRGACPAAGG